MDAPPDDRILETLSAGQVLLLSIIVSNIEKSREAINRKLPELAKRGLVTRVELGKSKITDRSRAYLEGEIDADELEDTDG